MDPLLYLVHRIPYPPNKGDKVRSYHLLKHLAERYRVFLGTFIDDPADWRHLPYLEDICAAVHAERLDPRRARLASTRGLLTGEALTLPYYRSRAMARWVAGIAREEDIRRIVVFSSAMAQYMPAGDSLRRIVDFVDVDSDKWRQYADKQSWPMSWVYRREQRRLLQFEHSIADSVDGAVFVSAEEAALFENLTGIADGRIHPVHNGVDWGFFDPGLRFGNPYPPGKRVLVFTGAMDYWPNVDAAQWFAREVLGLVRGQLPEASLYVVGARPTDDVRRLAEVPGVTVTGGVEDMRPYLAHAELAVAPLRVARGIQNKVLEALAMEKLVVATGEAAEGIGQCDALIEVTGSSARAFADAVTASLCREDKGTVGKVGRAFVREGFDWQKNFARFSELLEGE